MDQIQPYMNANTYSISNVTTVQPVGQIPAVYRNKKFAVVLINQSTNTITVNFVDQNGSNTNKVFILPPSAPSPALDFVPWEDIAGGITALASTAPSNLFIAVYSTEDKYESGQNLPADIILPHVNRVETAENTTLVREFAVI